MIERARLFATAAHAAVKQVRKYTGEPYIVHPGAVVRIVQSVPHSEEMVAAAWLHDVVEDTGVTIEMIEVEFGPTIRSLVWHLTDKSRPEDGGRDARKAIDRMHLAAAPAQAQTIKLADLIDNTISICERDPGFAQHVYLPEKALLIEVLTKGDPDLLYRAKQQVVRNLRL